MSIVWRDFFPCLTKAYGYGNFKVWLVRRIFALNESHILTLCDSDY